MSAHYRLDLLVSEGDSRILLKWMSGNYNLQIDGKLPEYERKSLKFDWVAGDVQGAIVHARLFVANVENVILATLCGPRGHHYHIRQKRVVLS